ncbi:MAG TPA: hypoxanthine-guanine phosphoribosyltransferase [Gammaproteobacteria bacterium]|nr:hypoxanthine-guanine phosphoribosyltransferase [Gammaproteobacteria bacterium]
MEQAKLLNEIAAVQAGAELLHPPSAVRAAVDRMASVVRERLAARNPLLLCVMTGGVMTTTWLAERLDFPLQIDYVHLTRYDGDTSGSNEPKWLAKPRFALAGRHVLLVDDIYDEGVTLRRLIDYCRSQGAADVASAVLVRKRHDRNRGGIEPDIVGLEVDDRYVFGCGLDYKNYLRNLPAIYAVTETTETGNDS